MTAIEQSSGVLGNYPDISRDSQPWSQPEMFDLSNGADQVRLEERLKDGAVREIHDPLPIVAQALCEYEHPETKGRPDQQEEYLRSIAEQGEEFGTWVLFPWSQRLSRFPDREDHQKLRTSRNRDLITTEEQQDLLTKKVAVLGLSVGSKALSSLVEGGIGGTYIIGDADHLDPTNTNRIDAGYTEVGESKVDIAAKKISEKDPWLEQIHLRDGMRPEDSDILAGAELIVEEVDNLAIKALVRLIAEKHGIPLLMATDVADKSLIDVERYDLSDGKKIMFNGRISREEAERISTAQLTMAENMNLMMKHVGVKHLTTRLMRSVMAMGVRLGGLPQLGMTATKGGADVSFAAREILLGHPLASGRYADSPRKTFRLGREASLAEGGRTALQLVKHVKSMKA